MSETVTQFYLYAGILLIGSSAAIHYFPYLRLRDTGRKYIAFNLVAVILSDYLRERVKHGWSPLASLLRHSRRDSRSCVVLCRRVQVVTIAVGPG